MQNKFINWAKEACTPFFSCYLDILWIQSSCFSDAGDLESLAQSSKGDPGLSYLWKWCLVLIKRKLANTAAVAGAYRFIGTVGFLLFTLYLLNLNPDMYL